MYVLNRNRKLWNSQLGDEGDLFFFVVLVVRIQFKLLAGISFFLYEEEKKKKSNCPQHLTLIYIHRNTHKHTHTLPQLML